MLKCKRLKSWRSFKFKRSFNNFWHVRGNEVHYKNSLIWTKTLTFTSCYGSISSFKYQILNRKWLRKYCALWERYIIYIFIYLCLYIIYLYMFIYIYIYIYIYILEYYEKDIKNKIIWLSNSFSFYSLIDIN